jgi:predicted DNA binding CopG/RHH family protein
LKHFGFPDTKEGALMASEQALKREVKVAICECDVVALKAEADLLGLSFSAHVRTILRRYVAGTIPSRRTCGFIG